MATESVVVYLFGQLALAVPRCSWPTRLVRSSTGCWSEVDILVSGILFAQVFIRFNLKALANHILKIYTIFSELVIQRSSSTFNPEACSLSSLWLSGRPFARLGCNIFQSSTDVPDLSLDNAVSIKWRSPVAAWLEEATYTPTPTQADIDWYSSHLHQNLSEAPC